jgi:hypothetical protein
MDLLVVIGEAWGWKGIEPIAIFDTNPFGNVIIKTASGHFWRICPEELSATQLADNDADFGRIWHDAEFLADWNMTLPTQTARDILGDAGEGRCYCLKIPGILGGKYEEANFATISLSELLAVSGSLAMQIDDVPDGAKVQLVTKRPS